MNERTMSRLRTAGAAVAGTLILAGCSGTAPAATPSDPDASTARFVACLTAAGIEATISTGTGMVIVRDQHGGTSGTGSDPGEDALMIETDRDGRSWVAAQSSGYFVDDPDTQDAYATCEREHSDFAQPEGGAGTSPKLRADVEKRKADSLIFARCAREAGFAWVADPAGGDATATGIALPPDLTEQQFRALLDACWSPDLDVTWEVEGEPSFDLLAVVNEFSGAAGPGGAAGGDSTGEK